MAWSKVDDQLAFHRKTIAAGNEAMGVWVRALAWSAGQLTDGVIAKRMALAIANGMAGTMAPEEAIANLVDSGLWVEVEGGYEFHDWFVYQPSSDETLKLREKRSQAGKAGAASKWKNSKPMASAIASDVANGMASAIASDVAQRCPVPVPVPKDKDSSSKAADATPTRPEVEDLCKHLAHLITENGNKPPTITKAWTDPARLLLDRDNRNPDEAHRLIDWCQTDTFWMGNILSMAAFRKQYDKLRMKADQNQGNVNAGTNRPPMSAAMAARHQDVPIQRMLERLKAKRANAAVGMEGEQDAADEIVAELQRLNVEPHWWAAA